MNWKVMSTKFFSQYSRFNLFRVQVPAKFCLLVSISDFVMIDEVQELARFRTLIEGMTSFI